MTDFQETLDKIKNFDCEPAVYKVFLICANHLGGYEAIASFRDRSTAPNVDSVSCHGETPEEAISDLLKTLESNFAKCPHCNAYPRKEKP